EGLDFCLDGFSEDILMNILDNNCFGWIIQVIENISDLNLHTNFLMRLERQWKTWEQPLLLLSFLLYPKYPWFKCDPKVLLNELQQFREKQYPFHDDDYRQFGKNDNILSFWNFVSGYTEELHLVAQHIYSICISSASIEYLFSTIGWLNNIRRDKLKHEKVIAICQICKGSDNCNENFEILNKDLDDEFKKDISSIEDKEKGEATIELDSLDNKLTESGSEDNHSAVVLEDDPADAFDAK
ncbi:5579_t:CDS:2, partial [Gigaspora margarita]